MKRAALCAAVLLIVVGIGPHPNAAAKAASGYPIAYMSVRAGNGDLHLLRGTVDSTVRGADSNGHDCGPAFKPGGKYLLFDSNRLITNSSPSTYSKDDLVGGVFQIYVLDLKTNKVRRLTTEGGIFPASSPDGRRIVYTVPARSGVPPGPDFDGSSLWVMNADGSGRRQLTLGSDKSSHLFPAWSPDGKKIAFTVTSDPPGTNPRLRPSSIYVVDPDGGSLRSLTSDGEYPAWSPDGKQIVFDSARGQANPLETDLYVMRADGSRQTKIDDHSGSQIMPDWSRDGKHIAYVNNDAYWTGLVMLGVLPTGHGFEVWGNGPPSQVWELTLGSKMRTVARRQLSTGETDLFPRYSPVRNPA